MNCCNKFKVLILAILCCKAVIASDPAHSNGKKWITSDEWKQVQAGLVGDVTTEIDKYIKFDDGKLLFHIKASNRDLLAYALLIILGAGVSTAGVYHKLSTTGGNLFSRREIVDEIICGGLTAVLTCGILLGHSLITRSHMLLRQLHSTPWITLDEEGIFQNGMFWGNQQKLYWKDLEKIQLTKIITRERHRSGYYDEIDWKADFVDKSGKVFLSISDKYLPISIQSFVKCAQYYHSRAKFERI